MDPFYLVLSLVLVVLIGILIRQNLAAGKSRRTLAPGEFDRHRERHLAQNRYALDIQAYRRPESQDHTG